jgi:hypothetical protein
MHTVHATDLATTILAALGVPLAFLDRMAGMELQARWRSRKRGGAQRRREPFQQHFGHLPTGAGERHANRAGRGAHPAPVGRQDLEGGVMGDSAARGRFRGRCQNTSTAGIEMDSGCPTMSPA